MSSSVRLCAMTLAALGMEACLSGTELVTPPRAPVTTITLEFRADSEDLATATALGWADGIPDVAVTLAPEDSGSGAPQHFHASAAGTVTLDQLAGGRYVVDAMRWMTDSERAQLPAGDDAVGFVTRVPLNTATATARMPVEMVASRRGGVLISEWKGDPIQTTGSPTYYFSAYLRLYNNADTAIYLDGLIVGRGLAWQFDYSSFPCSLFAPYTADSLGVWADLFYRLPGRGTDYPLLPGHTALLATDAIDHRVLYPAGLDLRQADFEFLGGPGDVDNPDVPNAVDVGVGSDALGHGLFWTSLGAVAFIAMPFDVATIQTQILGEAGRWGRIPATRLLQVMAIRTTYATGRAECTRLVHPHFDRQAVKLLGATPEDDLLAHRRIQLPFRIRGQAVLEYTRTSAFDFAVAPRNPPSIP